MDTWVGTPFESLVKAKYDDKNIALYTHPRGMVSHSLTNSPRCSIDKMPLTFLGTGTFNSILFNTNAIYS